MDIDDDEMESILLELDNKNTNESSNTLNNDPKSKSTYIFPLALYLKCLF